ncbi:hypothetical protein EI555_013552 [Monodon monoceros]|uniref:Uncharacterized protein n=1 Tax=Monodon monoceros TaxID=40151 RepID=A0A4U1F103_MONMO|nr:hypothetical protein EI555_013552 [Monodon monoceros]
MVGCSFSCIDVLNFFTDDKAIEKSIYANKWPICHGFYLTAQASFPLAASCTLGQLGEQIGTLSSLKVWRLMLASMLEFYQVCHTIKDYEESRASTCHHVPIFGVMS